MNTKTKKKKDIIINTHQIIQNINSKMDEESLTNSITSLLTSSNNDNTTIDIDSDLISYIVGMITDVDTFPIHSLSCMTIHEDNIELTEEECELYGAISPFLESIQVESSIILKICKLVKEEATKQVNQKTFSTIIHTTSTLTNTSSTTSVTNNNDNNNHRKLKQGIVSFSSDLDTQSEAEKDANRFLWGTDTGVAAFINTQKEAHSDTISAKEKRKQKQELEKTRREYEAKVKAIEEEEQKEGGSNAVVSKMVLPDYGSGKNEKDIHVKNVSLSLDNGRSLLDNADLKFSHKRRYGLVGKNGVGKTTLLKAIASMEIEGFPKHHRVLHVRQEVKSAGTQVSVLQAVLDSDEERNVLLAEETRLLSILEADGISEESQSLIQKREKLHLQMKGVGTGTGAGAGANDHQFEANIKRLDQVYARLNMLSSDSAESRAAQILSGLQFTPEMQSGPTSALSGGWRMRVSLAAALFIEPDLLLLDEPTNHLDLEAVLWLESYLNTYKHTLVVVSHDRGFLNEVCSDIIEFNKLKLTCKYYKPY